MKNRHTLRDRVRSVRTLCVLLLLLPGALASFRPGAAANAPDEGWVSLFDGKTLDGWTPKFCGSDLGENYKGTFRVEGGVIKAVFDRYEKFNGEFGHLFYREPFSNYVLRVEYRFVGEQSTGGPGWAFRNSGIMFHCQRPETMRRDQPFPVCIEAQFLGGNGSDERSTLNLCTPGTHVVIDGQLVTTHCINSKSKTFHGDQWVTAEIEVHGNGKIIHRVNGETAMQYEKPQLDPRDADARNLIRDGDLMVSGGYIALQAESHPVEFRRVEIRQLPVQ